MKSKIKALPKSGNGHKPSARVGRKAGTAPSAAAVIPQVQPNGPQPNAPHYGDGSRYGQAYYALSATDPEPTPPVAKVKQELKTRTDENLAAYVGDHIAMITGNAAFPSPQPLPADLAALLATFQTKLAAATQARLAAKEATTLKDQARKELIDAMINRGAYVQTTSNGNAALIESVGMAVVNPRAPIGPLPPPLNLRVLLNGVPGVAELRWDGVPDAVRYVVQCSPNVMPRQFTQVAITGKTRLLLEDLTLGEVCVFRAASIGGSTGQSPWSTEAIRGIA